MNDKDKKQFEFARIIAAMPIELFMSTIMLIIVVFAAVMYIRANVFYGLAVINVDYAWRVTTYFVMAVIIIVSIAISLPLSNLITVKTSLYGNIAYYLSFKYTFYLQKMLVRQIGNNFGAQGRIAKLSNINRLSSFVWVNYLDDKVIVAIRQDYRSDVSGLISERDLRTLINDMALMVNATATDFETITRKEGALFTKFRKYQVATLVMNK